MLNSAMKQGRSGGRSTMQRLSTLFLVLSLGLVACGDADTAQVTLVDPAMANDLLETNDQIVVLDVRTPEEVATGALPGARNIDISSPSFSADIAELDRDATYLVYCRSGNRSQQATTEMAGLGFTNIYELDGGIVAWVNGGFEIGN